VNAANRNFEVSRVLIQGVASEVVRDGPDGRRSRRWLLKQVPVRGAVILRWRVRPHRLSYAGADRVNFRTDSKNYGAIRGAREPFSQRKEKISYLVPLPC